MNVIISNQQDNITNSLNIEVIKSIHGEFDVEDIISSFSNFFFSRMVLDVTALKDYNNIVTYQKLSIGLAVDKIILLLPSQTEVSTDYFLSKLISMGYYNFTTNLEGIEYLLEHPNSYKDVAHIHQIEEVAPVPIVNSTNNNVPRRIILGVKNVTEGAGATTLTYMLYKELLKGHDINCLAVEVDKRDFSYFNDVNLVSVGSNELANTLLKNSDKDIIIVDLNGASEDICTETLYLVEPSVIKMNKLIRKNRYTFNMLRGKKIILNKCLLTQGDIKEFEKEIASRVYFVMPSFDDRTRPQSIRDLLSKLGIIGFQGRK